MAKASRDKGARGEREVCAIFQARGFDCYRTPNSGGLRIKGDVHGVPRLHLEVKRAERLAIPEWLRQAHADAPLDAVPVLCFRQSRQEWQVIIPLAVLADLLRAATPEPVLPKVYAQ